MTKIKLCGVRRKEDVLLMNKYQPHYIGFIVAPSKRQVTLEEVRVLAPLVNKRIQKIGVFVNAQKEEILPFVQEDLIDCIQLHGDEPPSYIEDLKQALSYKGKGHIVIIQAIRVKDEEDIQRANRVNADYVLLDKYHHESYGGIGESFNWELLKKMKRPYFLAGGVGKENIERALGFKPYALDLSSKIEKDGVKDEALIKALMDEYIKLKA
jgi:phosphoribosylanthranilate isomerase